MRRRTRAEGVLLSVHTPSVSWDAIGGRKMLMPEVLCFDDKPLETLDTLRKIRARLQQPTRGDVGYANPSKHRGGKRHWLGSYVAFETMRRIVPATALVLAAEYQGMVLRWGIRSFVAGIESWDARVFDTLWNIGFFDLVLGGEIEQPDMKADLVTLRMRSGDTTEPKEVQDLLDNLKMLYPNPDESEAGLVHLYGAMIEAVVNVVNHAYPESWPEIPPRKLRRWWMTGAVDRQNRRTTAVVYDRGVTIPVSLPNWDRAEGWKARGQKNWFPAFCVRPAIGR